MPQKIFFKLVEGPGPRRRQEVVQLPQAAGLPRLVSRPAAARLDALEAWQARGPKNK